jgi:transcriptional regulator with XRE-family HTH domain
VADASLMEVRPHVRANLGKRLREARTKRGTSQEVLAALAGLNRNYVNQVECGPRNISILNLLKLAAALDVDVTVLVRGLAGKP